MKYTYKHTLYACYLGYITQAIVNNLAPLLFIIFQTQFGISYEMIGRLIVFNFGTQIITDILAVKYVDKIGHRRSAVAAHIFATVGLISMGILPRLLPNPYLGLVISIVINAVGGGLIEVLISPIVESLPGDAKASAMSLLHSFYCWGQMGVVIITTVIIKIFGSGIWFLLPVLWAVVPAVNIFSFIKVPLVPPLPEGDKTPVRHLLSSRFFVLALLLMLCSGASEISMSQWSSLFAEKGLKVPKFMGDLLGPCTFALFMALVRTYYGTKGQNLNLKKALTLSGVLCICCYAVTVFIQVPIISLLGCALCGLTVALMWPGTLSLTAEAFPKGGTAMFGMLAIFGDVGAAVGPWMTGIVSDLSQKSAKLTSIGEAYYMSPDQFGLKFGLLVSMVFPIMFVLCIYLFRNQRTQDDS